MREPNGTNVTGGGESADAVLAARAASGDQVAFWAIYTRHVQEIHDYLALTTRDARAAGELTKESFLQAAAQVNARKRPEHVRAWLFGIADRIGMSHLGRIRPSGPVEPVSATPEDLEFLAVFGQAAATNAPVAGGEDEEAADIVWAAATSMDPERYSVLDLAIRRELNPREMGEVLEIKAAQATILVQQSKAAFHRAVQDLFVARRHYWCRGLSILVPVGHQHLPPDLRSAVEHHAYRCENCKPLADRLVRAETILATIPLIALSADLVGTEWPEIVREAQVRHDHATGAVAAGGIGAIALGPAGASAGVAGTALPAAIGAPGPAATEESGAGATGASGPGATGDSGPGSTGDSEAGTTGDSGSGATGVPGAAAAMAAAGVAGAGAAALAGAGDAGATVPPAAEAGGAGAVGGAGAGVVGGAGVGAAASGAAGASAGWNTVRTPHRQVPSRGRAWVQGTQGRIAAVILALALVSGGAVFFAMRSNPVQATGAKSSSTTLATTIQSTTTSPATTTTRAKTTTTTAKSRVTTTTTKRVTTTTKPVVTSTTRPSPTTTTTRPPGTTTTTTSSTTTTTGPPTISALSPPNGVPGAIVTISGSGFGPSGGSVSFEDDQSSSSTAPVVSWSENTIRVRVPALMTSGPATATVTFHAGGQQSRSFSVDPVYTGTWNGNRVTLSLEGTGQPNGQTLSDVTGFYTNNPNYLCLNQSGVLGVKDASGSSNPEAYGTCGTLPGEWTIS